MFENYQTNLIIGKHNMNNATAHVNDNGIVLRYPSQDNLNNELNSLLDDLKVIHVNGIHPTNGRVAVMPDNTITTPVLAIDIHSIGVEKEEIVPILENHNVKVFVELKPVEEATTELVLEDV